MIAERNAQNAVQTTMRGETVAMGIDQAAMAHIMSILTDLYSDPELAVIREYSTNALDANIEAGVSLPIEVTLPSALSPFFKVRDSGVGLNAEDIRSIYSQYGASTKRGTNDQVGMLGLGCKSALTYATQFTVTSVKDGVQTVVIVSRDEEGAGGMKIVAENLTDASNGTEVMVPTRAGNHFSSKSTDFFRHWTRGTVLVNGAAPPEALGLRLSDDILVVEDVGYGSSDTVVMGNVPYPVERGLLAARMPYGYSVVVTVPIGAVNFTPSREALHFTPRTKATLADIRDGFQPLLEAALVREVEKADSPSDAIKSMLKWRNLAPRGSGTVRWSFGGRAIPNMIPGRYFLTENASDRLSKGTWTADTGIHTERVERTLFVRNYDKVKFTPTHKKKLRHWLSMHADTITRDFHYFALSAGEPDPLVAEWFGKDRIIDWAPIDAIKLPREARATTVSGRIPGSYNFIGPDGAYHSGRPGDEIDQSKPVHYVRSARLYAAERYRTALGEVTVVALSENRIEKFCRLFPSAKDVATLIADEYQAWIKSLDDDSREALLMRLERAQRTLRLMDADKVDDPAIRRAIRLAKLDTDALAAKRTSYQEIMGWLDPSDLGETKDALEPYVLFDAAQMHYHPEHVYRYLNTEYLFRQAAAV